MAESIILHPQFHAEVTSKEGYHIETPAEVLLVCQGIATLNGRALLIGGCVRDSVISAELPEYSIQPKDFDIEVYGIHPDSLHAYLEQTFGADSLDLVGKAFGIIKVRIAGWSEPLDISIPRRDSKTGDGDKDFAVQGDPTMTIREAGKRRDLTMNAIAYDPLSKTVYDGFGGLDHIKNRLIEVTDVETFQEDPLRVLRVIQFAARFGFEIGEQTTQLCQEMVQRGDLDHLPSERITEEVKKLLLKGKQPSIGFTIAREFGITERYWPELHALIDIQQEPEWHPEGDVWTHTLQVVDAASLIAKREKLPSDKSLVLMLSALCHDFGKATTTVFQDGAWRAHGHEQAGIVPAQQFLNHFLFPSEIVKETLALVPEHMHPLELWHQENNNGISMDRALKRLAVRLYKGGSSIDLLSLLAEADQRGRNGEINIPLTREGIPSLEQWQSWILQKAVELQVLEQPPYLL